MKRMVRDWFIKNPKIYNFLNDMDFDQLADRETLQNFCNYGHILNNASIKNNVSEDLIPRYLEYMKKLQKTRKNIYGNEASHMDRIYKKLTWKKGTGYNKNN